jgi:3',5'-cyclic-AMP phosphodiesterase
MGAIKQPGFLSFVHFGDLHITDAEGDNHRDFQALVEQVNTHMRDAIAFAVLPGDNADDGTPAQFALVRRALERLAVPVHILPGGHDFKSKSLDAFYDGLPAQRLPFAFSAEGYRCLFLDMVSAGKGGPNFRLGEEHRSWLERQLQDADACGERGIIFMHAYPADLTEDGDHVADLFSRHDVALVDIGHTHYNEIANDGSTIYAATRSTGQIEEGPPGFAIVTLDQGRVGWRFKPIGDHWPVAMITSPADARLSTDAPDQPGRRDAIEIRASAWSAMDIASVVCAIDGGPWFLMSRAAGPTRWTCRLPVSADAFTIRLRVEDTQGHVAIDMVSVGPRTAEHVRRRIRGSDDYSIGAWPERHIFATQLGPNRNGRKW